MARDEPDKTQAVDLDLVVDLLGSPATSSESRARLGEVVASKLGPAFRTLADAPEPVKNQLKDSLAEAVKADPDFARELVEACEPSKGIGFRIDATDGAFPRYRIEVPDPPAADPVELREGFGFYPVRRKAEMDELCRRYRAVVLVTARTERGQGEINALSGIRRKAWPQISEMCAERNLAMAWVNLGTYLANLVSGGQDETVQEWLRINGYNRGSILVVVDGRVVRSRVLRFWADSDVLEPTRWTADKAPFRTAVEELLDGLL